MNFDHLDKMTNDELHDYMHNEEKTTEQWLELMSYSTGQWNEEKEEWTNRYHQAEKTTEEKTKELQKAATTIKKLERHLKSGQSAVRRWKEKCRKLEQQFSPDHLKN